MKTCWIVVANSTHVRILEAESLTSFREAQRLNHEDSRKHGRDIVTDRPGRVQGGNVRGPHAYEPPTTPHEIEVGKFAHEIAHFLEHARTTNAVKQIYLAAGPHLLGQLRSLMPESLKKIIKQEVPKDLTAEDIKSIVEHFNISLHRG